MFNPKQKKVIFGVVPAVLFILVFLYIGYYVIDISTPEMKGNADRLVFCLRWQILPLFTLLIGIGAIANSRFLTEAINPLDGKPSQRMSVYSRYLSNTLEQVILFFIATMILSTYLNGNSVRLIPVLAVLFVVGRVFFLIGYLIHPLYRAMGMGITMYPTIFIMFYDIYCMVGPK